MVDLLEKSLTEMKEVTNKELADLSNIWSEQTEQLSSRVCETDAQLQKLTNHCNSLVAESKQDLEGQLAFVRCDVERYEDRLVSC